ncbi:MAG: hypothetical protein ABIZ57_09455 [Candidatus Limnocylindria bacterium]
MPANVMVALSVVFVLVAGAIGGPLVAVLLAPILAFPLSGLFRLTGFIARGRDAVLSDVWTGWRTSWREILLLGVTFMLAVLIFGTNVLVAISVGDGVSVIIGVMAGWGLLGTWLYALLAWTILTDPDRVEINARERLRLAALMAIAFPLRLVAFSLLVAAFLAISTALFAAILTVSLAFAALVTCRYVLPAADRLSVRSGVAPSSATSD